MEELEEELRNMSLKDINDHPTKSKKQIAMEFFELATKKESIGQLHDAADFYRKAYKLNEKVDLEYREKLFSVPSTDDGTVQRQPLKILDLSKIKVYKLLDTFSDCEIISEDEEKPCIGVLPNEIIEHIMMDLMAVDTPTWVSLSLTCKRMVFIGFKSMNLWRYLSMELVYPAQYYKDCDGVKFKQLIKIQWGFNYYKMLNERPFLKFGGVYISKVTYMREGEMAENSNSWNLPFRMITYYRYYRFYADGGCLKLLSVLDPEKVVRSMKRGQLNEGGDNKWLQIYHGRYTMTLQGDVETNCEGSVPGYRFIDSFKIANGGKYHRHNKLQWKAMRCIRGEFDSELSIRNERDFIFSRVRAFSNSAHLHPARVERDFN